MDVGTTGDPQALDALLRVDELIAAKPPGSDDLLYPLAIRCWALTRLNRDEQAVGALSQAAEQFSAAEPRPFFVHAANLVFAAHRTLRERVEDGLREPIARDLFGCFRYAWLMSWMCDGFFIPCEEMQRSFRSAREWAEVSEYVFNTACLLLMEGEHKDTAASLDTPDWYLLRKNEKKQGPLRRQEMVAIIREDARRDSYKVKFGDGGGWVPYRTARQYYPILYAEAPRKPHFPLPVSFDPLSL